MALTQEEILVGIDKMPLYKKDYDIIKELIKILEPRLFTKIVEEVLEGTLYWSDFEKFFSNTDYHEILRNNLEVQSNLKRDLKLLSDFRKEIYNTDFTMLDNNKSLAVISPGIDEYKYVPVEKGETFDPNRTYYFKNGKADFIEALQFNADHTGFAKDYTYYKREENTFYEDEFSKIRDDLLYEITKINPEDSPLTVAFKIKLENAIRNGEYVLENIDSLSEAGLVDEKYVYSENKNEKFDYINPNDIFLYIGSYLIPLDINHQVLTRMDRLFMEENNLSEKQMKSFKAISLLLRRDMAVNGGI